MYFTLTIQADSISALRGKLSAYLAEISPQVIIGTNHEAGIIVPETKPRATRAKAPVAEVIEATAAEVVDTPAEVVEETKAPLVDASPVEETQPTSASTPPADTSEATAEPAEEGVSYETVRAKVLQISVAPGLGRDAVFKLLGKFGATKNAKEISEDLWGNVIEEADKILVAAGIAV